MRVSVFLLGLALAGCGVLSRSTDPFELGPGIYQVVARAAMGSEGSSEKLALDAARAHCVKTRREALPTNSRTLANGATELTYRCLNPGDPELLRQRSSP
jgi:hypothetical protein